MRGGINLFHWGNFLIYAVITAATPGPNNIMSMSNAGRLGFRRSLPFNVGIWAGFSVVMTICTLFCSLMAAVIPKIQTPMLLLGAGYLFYLAYKTLRSNESMEESHGRDGFLSGLLLQFVNPKIYLYGIVSMQVYILPHFSGQTGVLFGFALLLAWIGFMFTLCWAGFGSMFRLLFSKYAKITNLIMALLLCYCAVSLFL